MPIFSHKLLENIRNNQFDDKENCTDTQLDLSGQALDKKRMIALAEALAYNRSIEEVDLSECSISNKEIISFAQTFAKTLEKVKESATDGGPENGLWSNLFNFNLACNHITAKGIKKLWDAFPLQELDISENPIGDKGALLLAGTSLCSLKAAWCGISNIGASVLFASTTLEELNLSSNSGIKEEAFKTLAANESTALRKLTMKQAGLNGVCAEYIAKKASLQEVCLTTNNIGDEGAQHLARCNHLQVLYLGANGIGIKGAAAFGRTQEEVNRVFPFVNLASKNAPQKASSSETSTVPAQTSFKEKKNASSPETAKAACIGGETYLLRYQRVSSKAKKKDTALDKVTVTFKGTKNRVTRKKVNSK